MWAPEIRPAGSRGGYALSFTASRFATAQSPCPGYDEGSGVFMSYAATVLGPYQIEGDGLPHPVGPSPNPELCPANLAAQLPSTRLFDSPGCGTLLCNNTIRLDGDLFTDPQSGESWFAYAWYTNPEPALLPWEQDNLGEHVGIVRVQSSDPRTVPCDADKAAKVWAWSPHDAATESRMNGSCPRCGEQLSFVRGRRDQVVTRGPTGAVWGVTEGPMLFRRDAYVYLIISHSIWDSSYYAAAWAAAPSVEQLDIERNDPARIVGRLLIPSRDQSFGHGTAVLGPDNVSVQLGHALRFGDGSVQRPCTLPSDRSSS